MCERWIVLMGLAVLLTFDSGASAEFVGHWPFDGNLNDVAGTANGTFSGGQASYEKGRVRQAISFDGVDDYVDIPSPTNPSVYTIAAWIRPARTDAAAVITRTDASGPTTSWSHQLRINAAGQFHHYLWVGAERHVSGTTVIVPDTWYHVTIMAENDGPMRIFVNGIEEGTSISTAGTLWATGTRIFVGSNSGHSMGWFQGLVDDLQIYDEALAADQIRKVMRGDAAMSSDPYPEDGTADLPRDVVLRWSAGEFAATHDVYFGTVFDDVNDGSRANPMNVLVSQGQTAATYDPIGVLGFETTYYWRIDEVNAAPDNTIYKGEVWSFTTEPVAYPVGAIVATSNGISEPGVGPENTVNGSGLDAGDQHSTASDDMWLATPGADPLWIQYQFDRVYKLHQMLVWNYNVQFELLLGFGIKNVTVECSENGIDWTSLGDVDLARATAKATYEANTAVEFGGTPARFVRLNVNSGYGMMGQFGLSEVRFLFIPAQAREPQPTDGATGVAVASSLSWRAGREAVSHEVYYGTDPNALSLVGTTGAAGYTPEALTLATTYYWRVNEVNGPMRSRCGKARSGVSRPR
ncbi:MAG TPA: discoidin domain-containing protein, partial [Sedimentisphaerales bacterium]|nr:discoidin domain-containing protein [Sedimentisphaerales bacterium]